MYLLIPVHEIHGSIIVIVVMSTFRCIHRQHQVIRPQSMPLRVIVSESPTLEHLVIRVVDSGHHECRRESELLIFCEEVIDVPIQDHATNGLKRDQVLWPDLGNIQRVKIKLILIFGVHDLNVELPLGVVPRGNRVVKILCSMAVIGPAYNDGLVLQQVLHTTCRLPMELHIVNLSGLVDECEGVDTESFHVPVIQWNANVIVVPSERVKALRDVRAEVENPPILLNVRFWVRFEGVDHVGELHPVTNEEHREVVSD